jgi:hypothetical protein
MPVSLEKQKPAIDLSQFYGTENYYRHPFTQSVYTDGVRYFAEVAGAYWFLDIVFSEYDARTREEVFLTIYLQAENGKADITVLDGNGNKFDEKHIDITDCPDGIYQFYFYDSVLMLTSEY